MKCRIIAVLCLLSALTSHAGTWVNGSKVADSGAVTNPMTEDLSLGGNDITNVGTVDGVDVGTDVPLNTTHRGSAGTDHSDVGLNNTHRGSNGTDHSYIDQDVTTTGTPTFATVNATGSISTDTTVVVNDATLSTPSSNRMRSSVAKTGNISYYELMSTGTGANNDQNRLKLMAQDAGDNEVSLYELYGVMTDATDGAHVSELRFNVFSGGSPVYVSQMTPTVINFKKAVDVIGNITLSGTVDGIDVGTDVAANTTHRGSNGTDHSYIDQDVTTTGSPTHAALSVTGDTDSQGAALIDQSLSAGLISGGVITDAGGGTIDVSEAVVVLRTTDSPTGVLTKHTVAAISGAATTADAIRWAGYDYNAGTPQFIQSATDSFTRTTIIPTGSIVNEGGSLHISNAPIPHADVLAKMVHTHYDVDYIAYATRIGGLKVADTGTNELTMTAGELYLRSNEFDITSKDTSGADTMDRYYYNGAAWVKEAAQTTWDNTQYNNIASGLVTMTNNRYANAWIYVELDDVMVIVYGRAAYVSLAAAEAELPPATLPNRLAAHGFLCAQLVFQKSDTSSQAIIDWTTTGASGGAQVVNHNDLGGLDTGEYIHMSSAEAGGDWGAIDISTTGSVKGAIDVDDNASATVTVTAAQCYGAGLRNQNASVEWDLPPAVIGMRVSFANDQVDAVQVVDPNGTDIIVREDGTPQAAGVSLDSAGDKADRITLWCTETGRWEVWSERGTWSVGS